MNASVKPVKITVLPVTQRVKPSSSLDTPMVATDDPDGNKPLIRATPMRRSGEPEDIARVALFLASDDASYVNAIDIVVDGGQSVIV